MPIYQAEATTRCSSTGLGQGQLPDPVAGSQIESMRLSEPSPIPEAAATKATMPN